MMAEVSRKYKYVHIFSADKFVVPFIECIDRNFDSNEHLFVILGVSPFCEPPVRENIVTLRGRKAIFHLYRIMRPGPKLFVHGLFEPKLLLALALRFNRLKKSFWIMWGGDVYFGMNGARNFHDWWNEKLRQFVLPKFGHLISHIRGDADIVKERYGGNGIFHSSLTYMSNVFVAPQPVHCRASNSVNILIGNSADPSNGHFQILDLLKSFSDKNIQMFAPLSYGDPSHAETVAKIGREMFGDRFTPIFEFMSRSEYARFLDSIDIAVFNHNRQQAMGVIISLLGTGKKVFLRTGTTHWNSLLENGIEVCSMSEFSIEKPILYSENMRKIRAIYSEDNLIRQLRELFEMEV